MEGRILSNRQIVFVSCGQCTTEEVELGRSVERLVEELTPYAGYFAQNESNLDGVTQNILGSLDKCVGIIAIMHDRGSVTTLDGPRVRASVWIEQEIAVAAYIRQILRRPLEIRLYAKRGISIEGMREKLLANPIYFDFGEEVLRDLETFLPKWQSVLSFPRQDKDRTEAVNLQCRVERIIQKHVTLQLKNDSDEEVRLLKVQLRWNKLDLAPPFYPPATGCTIPARGRIPLAWSTNEAPVEILVRMNPNDGLKFQKEIEVILEFEVLGIRREREFTRRVKVYRNYLQAEDVGPEVF